jgi:hypothetical protein
MAQSIIPLRPKGKFKLSKEECDCLSWYVISGCKQADAYATFVRPDLALSKSLLMAASKQFFASVDASSYVKAYRKVLDNNTSEADTPFEQPSDDDIEGKKIEAIKSLINWATEQSINISDLNEDTATLVLKVADKVGLFEDMTKAEEAPRRYLPCRCQTECQYRLFVEQAQQDGQLLCDCDYCKAKAFAIENGFHFDATKLLDIPQDVLQRYDLENYTVVNNDD